jgi:hypothetical protein
MSYKMFNVESQQLSKEWFRNQKQDGGVDSLGMHSHGRKGYK